MGLTLFVIKSPSEPRLPSPLQSASKLVVNVIQTCPASNPDPMYVYIPPLSAKVSNVVELYLKAEYEMPIISIHIFNRPWPRNHYYSVLLITADGRVNNPRRHAEAYVGGRYVVE